MVLVNNCGLKIDNTKFLRPFSAKIGFNDRESFFCVDVKYPEGGSYFSCLPISTKTFRDEYKTKCGYNRTNRLSLVIYDDWGIPHKIISEERIIDLLTMECIDNEIPERIENV